MLRREIDINAMLANPEDSAAKLIKEVADGIVNSPAAETDDKVIATRAVALSNCAIALATLALARQQQVG